MNPSRAELIVSVLTLVVFAFGIGAWIWIEAERSRRARETLDGARAISEAVAGARGFDA